MTGGRILARSSKWLLRLVAGLSLLLLAAVLALRTKAAGEMAAGQVVDRLRAATGRDVRVEGASLEVLPPGIEIHGLALSGPGGSFEPPVLAAERATVALSLEDLLRGRLVIDSVEADGVTVEYSAAAGSTPPSRRASGRRFELRRVNVRRGTFIYHGVAAPFDLRAESLDVTGASIPCEKPICLEGAAAAGKLTLRYADHSVAGDAVSISFTADSDTIEVHRFSVAGAGLRASGEARLKYSPSPAHARLTSQIHASGDAAARLLGTLPLHAQEVAGSATITVREGAAVVQGKATLSAIDYPGLATASSAEGTFGYADGTITVDATAVGVSPRLAGVRPSGTGRVVTHITRTADGEGRADITAGPILYRDLLGIVDSRLPASDSLVTARGTIHWKAGDPTTPKGALDLELVPFSPGRSSGSTGGSSDEDRDEDAGYSGRDTGGGQNANDDADAKGKGDRDPNGEAGEDVRPKVPIRGTARVEIGPHSVRITSGRLSFPGLDVTVGGTIGRPQGDSEIDLTFERLDLAQTLPSLKLLPAAAVALSQHLSGKATGTLHVSRRASLTTAEGSLRGAELTLRSGETIVGPFGGSLSIKTSTPAGGKGSVIHLGRMDLAAADWWMKGDVDLDTGKSRPLRAADLSLQNVPAQVLWSALAVESIEGGRLTGSAAFSFDDPSRGDGSIRLTAADPTIVGVTAQSVDLDAGTHGAEVQIRSLSVRGEAGVIEGTGVVDAETMKGNLDLGAKGVLLEPLVRLLAPKLAQAGVTGGTADFEGAVRFDPARADLEGRLMGHSVALASLPLGDITANLTVDPDGSGAEVTAPEIGARGRFTLPFRPGSPVDVDLDLDGFPLTRVRSLLPPSTIVGLAGRASAHVWGSIPTEDPWAAALNMKITNLLIETEAISLESVDPAPVTMRDGAITVSESSLTGPGTEITIAGVYDLRGRTAGTGSLKGHFDSKVFTLFLPALQTEGSIEIDLHATSERGALVYGGTMRTQGLQLDYPGAPAPITDLRATMTADPDGSVKIEDIAFDFAGGDVVGEGRGQLKGLELATASIELTGRSMSTEPVPDLRLLFDGAVSISKVGPEGTIAGRLDVIRAIYSREFELEATRTAPRRGGGATERALPAGRSLELDVEVIAPSDVLVRNKTAQIEGAARLHFGGTLTKPEVTGRISLFEGGKFRFRDVTYTSEGGGIDLDDPDVIDPLLDLTAKTQVREYEITLHVLGRYSKPRFELTAEPSLSQRDIVALLVTGKTYSESFGVDAGASFLAEENVSQYLTAPLSEALGSTVGRFLNLTSVQIQPQFIGGRSDASARLTLTKRVSPDLLFVYSDSLGTNQEQIYQFEYDVTKAWQILGSRDFDGALSGNVTFRHRWGGPRPLPQLSSGGPVGAGAEVGSIEIQGYPGEVPEDLRKNVRVKTGREYTRADALEGRENMRRWLERHDYPLAQVRLVETPRTPEDAQTGAQGRPRLDLIYEITTGPKVGMKFEGVRRTKPLGPVVREGWERTLKVNDLGPVGAEALRTYYGDRGRSTAVVTSAAQKARDELTITFTIDPGPKVSVDAVAFEGVVSVPEEEIRRAIETREDHWYNSGLLRTTALKADTEAIRSVFLANGYLDATVGSPVLQFTEDRHHVDVTFQISEGQRWILSEVQIAGAETYPVEVLREATLLTPGAPLSPSALDGAVERLRDLLDANGYNAVRVDSRVEGPPEAAKAVFEVEEGKRQILDRIVIRGNQLTSSRVIQREIVLRPGDPVSRAGVLETQRKLYNLGVFKSVDVRVATDADDPARAKLSIDVLEGDPLLTLVGGGYNTEKGPQGFVLVGHNNIFGSGRSLSALLRGSGVDRRAQLSVSDRRLFGIPFDGLASVFYEVQERPSYEQRGAGGGLQLTRKLSSRWTLFGRYNIEQQRHFNFKISQEEERALGLRDVRLAYGSGSFARDTRDDILNPTKGTFSTGDARFYLVPFGSQEQFLRFFASSSWFHPLTPEVIFATSGRLGISRPFGSTDRVPLGERFFAGGDNTLRGFDLDKAGPLDIKTLEPLGGELSVLFNAELRFPVAGPLRGVLFYDAGNSFYRTGALRWGGTEFVDNPDLKRDPLLGKDIAIQDGIRHVGGIGIRYGTPLGPLRIEFGRKLDRHVNDPRYFVQCGTQANPKTCLVSREESLYEIFLSVGPAF